MSSTDALRSRFSTVIEPSPLLADSAEYRSDRTRMLGCGARVSLSLVGRAGTLTGLWFRRLSRDDGTIRRASGTGEIAFARNRRGRSDKASGATAAPMALATSACSGRSTRDAPASASPTRMLPPPTRITGTSSAREDTRSLAAVNGATMGGSFELALSADTILAAERARGNDGNQTRCHQASFPRKPESTSHETSLSCCARLHGQGTDGSRSRHPLDERISISVRVAGNG